MDPRCHNLAHVHSPVLNLHGHPCHAGRHVLYVCICEVQALIGRIPVPFRVASSIHKHIRWDYKICWVVAYIWSSLCQDISTPEERKMISYWNTNTHQFFSTSAAGGLPQSPVQAQGNAPLFLKRFAERQEQLEVSNLTCTINCSSVPPTFCKQFEVSILTVTINSHFVVFSHNAYTCHTSRSNCPHKYFQDEQDLVLHRTCYYNNTSDQSHKKKRLSTNETSKALLAAWEEMQQQPSAAANPATAAVASQQTCSILAFQQLYLTFWPTAIVVSMVYILLQFVLFYRGTGNGIEGISWTEASMTKHSAMLFSCVYAALAWALSNGLVLNPRKDLIQ